MCVNNINIRKNIIENYKLKNKLRMDENIDIIDEQNVNEQQALER